MRMSLLALICAALLLAACTSNSGDDSSGTPEGDATAVTTATAATGASDDATASDAPTDEGDAPVLVQRFIGNTGGSGVAVRDACAQDARAGGAWPQASGVLVLEVGTEGCDGWSYVARDRSSDESWVRNTYLVTERPAAVVSRLPTTTPTSPPATSTNTPPTPAPTQAPNHLPADLDFAEPAQLRRDPARPDQHPLGPALEHLDRSGDHHRGRLRERRARVGSVRGHLELRRPDRRRWRDLPDRRAVHAAVRWRALGDSGRLLEQRDRAAHGAGHRHRVHPGVAIDHSRAAEAARERACRAGPGTPRTVLTRSLRTLTPT